MDMNGCYLPNYFAYISFSWNLWFFWIYWPIILFLRAASSLLMNGFIYPTLLTSTSLCTNLSFLWSPRSYQFIQKGIFIFNTCEIFSYRSSNFTINFLILFGI
jgi:hypothetical protein